VINVVPASLTITVDDVQRVYGQDNPAFTAHYSGFVKGDTPAVLDGTLVFRAAATPASDVGVYDITAAGLTSSNYTIGVVDGTLIVTPADRAITWAAPADIVYGTPPGPDQLDATVSVSGPAPPGALTYAPEMGTILKAGNAQVLTVVASATNNYKRATASVPINVAKATPVLAWSAPTDIIYGTPLGPAQLNATISTPGAAAVPLIYSPPAGTVLHAGTGQELSVTAAATDNTNEVTATVPLNVLPMTPMITWSNPADIVYGTPLSSTQLAAAASVPGTFTYAPAAGDVLDAGRGLALMATFTPDDPANFNPVMVSTQINVNRASLVVTASDVATTYGALVPALTGSVVGLVNNDPVGVTFASAAGVGSPVGTYAITPTLVDPNQRMGNYRVTLNYGTVVVGPAALRVTANDAQIAAGQALPSFNARFAGFVLGQGPNILNGSLSFRVPPGATSQAGRYPITPGGLSAANYAITYIDGSLNVTASQASSSPPATVVGTQWQTTPPGPKKTAKALVVTFSTALDVTHAQNPNAYRLVTSGRDRTFGSRGARTILLASATYNATTHSVKLIPQGKLPKQALQLTINAALVLDAQGRPIDGNRDGQPGGNFVAILKS
jgi:hypothetical protein